MKAKFSVLIFLLCINTLGISQVTIILSKGTTEIRNSEYIYFASNINKWNPKDSKYKLQLNQKGSYQLSFNPPVGKIEYKFTKGSWKIVEVDVDGNDIPNRILDYDGSPMMVEVSIANWKNENAPSNISRSTAASNVSILKEDFNIPQLNRERRIWIYLPPNYESTDESYPVLYMHDGQNLFDASTSFSGEWKVDESLNELFGSGDKGVIVVGIENGEDTRIEEYTPWQHSEHGGGEGKKYVNFIVETLKPYIDGHFRTKPDRKNTGIMGSSLGGLISFYAAIHHQDVFSKAGIFSPSFWFSDEVYEMVDQVGKIEDMKFYFLGGELESEDLVDEINAMSTTLLQAGFEEDELVMKTHPDGEHNERYWSREFKDCYSWLFR